MTRWSGATATINALDSNLTRAVLFAELLLDGGTERLHTRLGEIQWGGNTWYGVGAIAALENLSETQDLRPDPIRLALTGITTEIENMIDSEEIYNRGINLYLGAVDSSGNMVEDPPALTAAFMQQIQVTTTANEGSVAILTAINELYLLNKSRNVMYTDAQLQSEYAGDLFFEYTEKVADSNNQWGGKSVSLGGSGNTAERPGRGGGIDEYGNGGENFY